MAKVRTSKASDESTKMRSALTPEAREQQLIYLATNLAEKQLQEGTASSQVITHYLKLGTMKEKLERDILIENKKLLTAKTEAIEASKESKELYMEALRAMKIYSGNGDIEDEPEDY